MNDRDLSELIEALESIDITEKGNTVSFMAKERLKTQNENMETDCKYKIKAPFK